MGADLREFCLKWNNHHSTLVDILDRLLEREKLVDVTLAADGQCINVHKFVLYACSQYFEVTIFFVFVVLFLFLHYNLYL